MSATQSYTRNCLLSALAPEDFALLQPHLERVDLGDRDVLVVANEPIEQIHFPEGGVVSIVTDHEDGAIEVGIFGRDGMSGTALLLGADRTPHRTFVQVAGGKSLRISATALRDAWRQSEALHTTLLRYVQAFTIQAAQTAAANAQYDLPERLARWLLMCHDRLESDEIHLTHEFMAMMLAVRRSGVTVTLHVLEGNGAIQATRGLVRIKSRKTIRRVRRRLLRAGRERVSPPDRAVLQARDTDAAGGLKAEAHFGPLATWVSNNGPASHDWTMKTLGWRRPEQVGIVGGSQRADYSA